ncbi:ABC transporter substrate-binding protein [Caldisalinibacter kiritimatiensis]|uniref:Amino acid ABC transporter, amino acid-binding protein n=1 Tax=Caldisalinibacter kiritimatiensis TaxID=1304284 RepID=R1AVW9_9FIRM|nr:ABC transporter substrate-binding protein [Caldisalinibacter kiritimatiensis]EOD01333.1 Amino acid ABC transporter, amino acid-binding protein [Caldisalinibacter kiritimatiensis]
MYKNIKVKLISTVLLIIILFTLYGCTNSGETAKQEMTKLEEIKEKGKIVLGTSADYPPYEFHKEINGKDEIVGFDIEIAKQIAKELGVELEIKDMKFDGLLAALQMNKIDFIVAGMTPTEERKENADFSKTYYEAEQCLLVKKGDGSKYKEIDDLSGIEVGVQKSTIQEQLAKEKIEDAEIKALSKITSLVLELKNNKVDGIVLVKPVAEAYAKANKDLEVAEVSLGKEDGVAIAVKKGNTELMNAINKTIDKLMKEGKISQFINEATHLSEED